MNPSAPIIPRLDLTRVEDVMHTGLVGCASEAPLGEIARLLAEERTHSVVVGGIERTRSGERLSWGIVSDWMWPVPPPASDLVTELPVG